MRHRRMPTKQCTTSISSSSRRKDYRRATHRVNESVSITTIISRSLTTNRTWRPRRWLSIRRTRTATCQQTIPTTTTTRRSSSIVNSIFSTAGTGPPLSDRDYPRSIFSHCCRLYCCCCYFSSVCLSVLYSSILCQCAFIRREDHTFCLARTPLRSCNGQRPLSWFGERVEAQLVA